MEQQRIRLNVDGMLIATVEDYIVTGVHDDHCDIELINVQPIDRNATMTLASWTWRDMELVVDHGYLRYIYANCSWNAFSRDGEFRGPKSLQYSITTDLPEEILIDPIP